MGLFGFAPSFSSLPAMLLSSPCPSPIPLSFLLFPRPLPPSSLSQLLPISTPQAVAHGSSLGCCCGGAGLIPGSSSLVIPSSSSPHDPPCKQVLAMVVVGAWPPSFLPWSPHFWCTCSHPASSGSQRWFWVLGVVVVSIILVGWGQWHC